MSIPVAAIKKLRSTPSSTDTSMRVTVKTSSNDIFEKLLKEIANVSFWPIGDACLPRATNGLGPRTAIQTIGHTAALSASLRAGYVIADPSYDRRLPRCRALNTSAVDSASYFLFLFLLSPMIIFLSEFSLSSLNFMK